MSAAESQRLHSVHTLINLKSITGIITPSLHMHEGSEQQKVPLLILTFLCPSDRLVIFDANTSQVNYRNGSNSGRVLSQRTTQETHKNFCNKHPFSGASTDTDNCGFDPMQKQIIFFLHATQQNPRWQHSRAKFNHSRYLHLKMFLFLSESHF